VVEKGQGNVFFYRAGEAACRGVEEGDCHVVLCGLHCIGFERQRGNGGWGGDGVVQPFQKMNSLWSLHIYGMHGPLLEKTQWTRNWREPEAIK
jgi:hypothetical protein